MKIKRTILCIVLIVFLFSLSLSAQTEKKECEKKYSWLQKIFRQIFICEEKEKECGKEYSWLQKKFRQISIYEENDSFGFPPSDELYTQGFRVELSWSSSQSLLPIDFFYKSEEKNGFVNGVYLAQNMYTPKLYYPKDSSEVKLHEQPFAGWLHGGVVSRVIRFDEHDEAIWQDTWELDIGLVGPWSLGEGFQAGLHRMVNANKPNWIEQMPNELTLLASFERQWSKSLSSPSFLAEEWKSYIIPKLGVRAGNVFDDITVGAKFITGWNAPNNFAAGSTMPAVSNTSLLKDNNNKTTWSLYFFLGGEFRSVFYNRFLDRTRFYPERNIEFEKLVAEYFSGVAFQFSNGSSISFTVFRRSPQWTNFSDLPEGESLETSWHEFGQIKLSYVF